MSACLQKKFSRYRKKKLVMSDMVLSNCPMIAQWCVQPSNRKFSVNLSDGWSAECSTAQWSDCALSNCTMVRQCCFKLSNAWTVLCLIVQWSDSTVSYFPMVKQCCPSIIVHYTFSLCNSEMIWKDNYMSLNCLGGQNVAKFCAYRWIVWGYKSFLSESFKCSAPLARIASWGQSNFVRPGLIKSATKCIRGQNLWVFQQKKGNSKPFATIHKSS